VQRDFRSPVRFRLQACVNPSEQPCLGHVTNWIAGRIQAKTRHESDRRTESTQLTDAELLELAALEAPDLAPRYSDRPAEVILAETDRDPRRPDLGDGVRRNGS
jgi:hypothetical protein